MRATPPSRRMSAGTRSSAMTAHAPASSAIRACSAFVTSMMTPPLSISARPLLTRMVPCSAMITPLFSTLRTRFASRNSTCSSSERAPPGPRAAAAQEAAAELVRSPECAAEPRAAGSGPGCPRSFGGFAAGAASGLGSAGGGAGGAGGAARAGAAPLKRGRLAAEDAVPGRVARAAAAPAGGRGVPARRWPTTGGVRRGVIPRAAFAAASFTAAVTPEYNAAFAVRDGEAMRMATAPVCAPARRDRRRCARPRT